MFLGFCFLEGRVELALLSAQLVFDALQARHQRSVCVRGALNCKAGLLGRVFLQRLVAGRGVVALLLGPCLGRRLGTDNRGLERRTAALQRRNILGLVLEQFPLVCQGTV